MVDRINEFSYRQGTGKVVTQGMRVVRTAATTDLGSVKPLHFEREIIYVRISTAAAVAQGRLVQAPALVANHIGNAVSVTASIGAKSVTVCAGATAITKDQYADGLLFISSGTGSGYSYVIQTHASAASGSGVALTLKDELEVALNTTSRTLLIPNPYNNCIELPAGGATGKIIGVTLISAAAGSYVWLGKKGIWPAYVESAALTPNMSVTSGCAAGTVQGLIASLDATARIAHIGIAICSAAAANSYGLVDFKL